MSRTTAKTRNLVQLSLLIALEAVMAFTPLGFIMIPPISITILHIPVIIGAILMGPTYGGILGGAFGVLAMTVSSDLSVTTIGWPPISSFPPSTAARRCSPW